MNKKIEEIHQILLFTSKLIDNLDNYINAFYELYPKDLQKEQIQDKLIAETALLLYIVNRLPKTYGLNDLVLQIANKIEKYARNPKHLLMLSYNPQAVIGVGLAHVMLNKLGITNDFFDETIRLAFSSKFISSVDRPNFRQMEMEWLYGVYENTQANFSDLLPCSLILKPMHPIYMRREDAYAITHALMYITNFGETDFNDIDKSILSGFVENCISWCLAYADWDLLIEVLIVDLLIDNEKSQFYLMADNILNKIFAQDKVIQSLNFSNDRYNELEQQDKEAYFMMQAYHTTYVYAIFRAMEIYKHTKTNNNATSSYNKDLTNNLALPIVNSLKPLDYSQLINFILTENIENCSVLINAKIIYFAQENMHEKLFSAIQAYENGDNIRLKETCAVAGEKIIQYIRATAYKQLIEA